MDSKDHQRQLVNAWTRPTELMVMDSKYHQRELVDASAQPIKMMVMESKYHQRQLVDTFDPAYGSKAGPVVND